MNQIKKLVKQWIWLALIAFCLIGLVYPVIGAIALICMLSPVAVAFFKGRQWCGNFCPRGSFNDIILSKFSFKKGIPKLFQNVWFKKLFLAVLMGAFAVQLIFAWGNAVSIGHVFVRMIIITTLLTIFLGITYNHRSWCLICPMGTMARFAARMNSSRKRAKHITFKKDKCVNCKICSKNCPMSIDVLKHKVRGKVLHPDCLKCRVCVEKCPKKSLYVA